MSSLEDLLQPRDQDKEAQHGRGLSGSGDLRKRFGSLRRTGHGEEEDMNTQLRAEEEGMKGVRGLNPSEI